jgi:hypothetical protein
MNHQTIAFAMTVAALTLFFWNRILVVIVSNGVSLTLLFTGILPVNQALGGFSDLTVIFISSQFVVAAGPEAPCITIWSGHFIIEKMGARRTGLRSSLC